MTSSRPVLKAAFLLSLVGLQSVALTGCTSYSPDKRILQYLNTDGFGKRYTGNAEEENYVSIGDSILFADSFHPELRGGGKVDIDGTIIVPEAGAVHVAGLTRSEIEGLLTQKLSPYYEQNDIQVQIQAPRKFYFVIGEVAGAGQKPFPGDLTVLEAVLQANPKEYMSNLGRVQLIRADPQQPFIMTVDISEMLKTGDTTFNVHVQENDILYIPPTFLKEIANFLAGLLVPFTEVFSAVFSSIFFLGGSGRGRGNQDGGYGGGGGIF
ncbi:MAG: polysaccharide biosynthesis/export family protein [Planctomycetota bacterium]|nr:polysaccharide biosynthesis/export family protein [Planctomycetota bacterium]